MSNLVQTTQPLYSTIGTDPDFQELVTLFVQEMPERIQKILDCLNQGNLEDLHRLCHQLKGSAGGYGFPPISEAAAKVVDALRNHSPEEQIWQTVSDLLQLCQRARAGGPSEKDPAKK